MPTARSAAALPALVIAGSIAVLARAPSGVQAMLPPCPIHRSLGILCPGCGGTRACIALLHGHLAQAWHFNALLLLLAPLLLLYAGVVLYRLWRGRGNLFPSVPASLTYTLLAAAAIFTLARNLSH